MTTTVEIEVDARGRVDDVVATASAAAQAFRRLDQTQVDAIVEAMVRAGVREAIPLAQLAVEETGFGVFEDKVVKNFVATEFLHDYLRGKRSVGRDRRRRRAQRPARGRADRRRAGRHAGDQPDVHGAVQGDRGGQDA